VDFVCCSPSVADSAARLNSMLSALVLSNLPANSVAQKVAIWETFMQ
jgi:hypothetical protein